MTFPITASSRRCLLAATALGLSMLVGACATPAPNGNTPPAKGVWFIEPADGASVSGPVKVKFGLNGMAVKPAGELAEGTGHHHLLVNVAGFEPGRVIPADASHLHFGKGQTETELKLAPGTYKLTLQFADGLHQSYGPTWSNSITVKVQ